MLFAACLLLSPVSALIVGPPKLGSRLPNSRALAASAAPVLTALPVAAIEEAGDIPDVVNLGLTALLAAPVLYIAKFAFDAAAEAASQTDVRLERAGLTGKTKGPRTRQADVFDDTDFSYRENSQAVENSRTRKKLSKQQTADGKRFAPWMVIDEAKVEKVKAERNAAKKAKKAKKAGDGGGGGGGFFGRR